MNDKKFQIFFLLLTAVFSNNIQTKINSRNTDLIIFSFDRPLQLYAVLESVKKYFSNLNATYVLYRTSNQQYDAAYHEIKLIFPQVNFVQQGSKPREDFKPLLMQCFFSTSAEYILFSVDDVIIKDYVDCVSCAAALEKFDAYCFYLRLGENIMVQYNQDITIGIPQNSEIHKDIVKFKLANGKGDWAYAHSLDMVVFKKSEIVSFYVNADYSSPNTLESEWSGVVDLNHYALCFRTSKVFTLPLNIVQEDWWVPNENSLSVQELFNKWQQGLIFDITQFFQINNNCAVMGYMPHFIKRN